MNGQKYKLIPEGKVRCGDGWCFAMVNGKLAEIFFRKPYGIWGFCYVRLSEYDRRERRMIAADVKKYRFTYRGGYYYDRVRMSKQREPKWDTVFPPSALKNTRLAEDVFKSRRGLSRYARSLEGRPRPFRARHTFGRSPVGRQ